MRWTLLCFGWMALACSESVESEDIRTTGIYPEIEVTANGDGSSLVRVRLKVGGSDSNTFLNLTGDDTLEATADGTTRTLDETADETYTARFQVDAEGTEFTVAFLRGEADENAPESTVALPAPFEITPLATEASRATDDVAVEWEPAGPGDMDWEIEGDCIISDDGSVPDDGTHTIAAGTIDTFESDMEETCTVEVGLSRSQSGTIDGAFTEGGRIVARHVRFDSFTSAP